ncbi:hypothetical protein [Verrucomicrobium sp. BvORR106]|uniref:hypothetical protein n=1 Tax=Verrucomicrobium sp. BvORR106 TaxID=1403819 RepID=UPI00056F6D10|nr:hypothetical protein [Verrucomicrobium sp. BvORR106]
MKSFSYFLSGLLFGAILCIPFMRPLPGFVSPLLALVAVVTLLVAAGLPRLNSGGFLHFAAVRVQKVELDLLRKRIKSLRAVIEFYGAHRFYSSGACQKDRGAVARRALQYDDNGQTSSSILKLPNGED